MSISILWLYSPDLCQEVSKNKQREGSIFKSQVIFIWLRLSQTCSDLRLSQIAYLNRMMGICPTFLLFLGLSIPISPQSPCRWSAATYWRLPSTYGT